MRIGFLVPPDDLKVVSRVARLSCCLWGGRYNPIIPFFETGGERWRPHHRGVGIEVARGYVDFFEPDVLVETKPGMAEKLGWQGSERFMRGPRVVQLDEFYELDYRGHTAFATGIDIIDVMTQLYRDEFQYERRHKLKFADIGDLEANAFFDVVGGRYPADEAFKYIRDAYGDVFDAEKLPPTYETAHSLLQRHVGPLWVTRHGLTESMGRGGGSDQTFCIFDPSDPGDVIDFWNFRLVERRTIPVNLEWLSHQQGFIRERITENHRPIPGNPYGTKFYSIIQFSSSITNEQLAELTREYFAGLPDGSFHPSRSPEMWRSLDFGIERRETKIIAAGEPVPFDEEVTGDKPSNRYVRIPAPAPTFLNASRKYTDSRWINLIVPSASETEGSAASMYPTNLFAPKYPNLAAGHTFRIGREGWALSQESSIGYSLLQLQTGREAIIGWLATLGIEATPSEAGQIAAQVITAAGSLLACGMFADRDTLALLNKMAEGHSEVPRDGARVGTNTPDRSKHVHTVRQHFESRSKRSFGYWNELEHFLKQSVFRIGLRVRCPTCAYQNWYDLDAVSYSPTCSRCLNKFEFPQAPNDLKDVQWFYRVVGPFAVPDYARGAYAVALALRCLAPRHNREMTWSTGLTLKPPNREVDFIAWYRPGRLLQDERDEPLVLIGEAKSFGWNVFDDEAVNGLRRIAERLPGALMVVASLKDISAYSSEELQRLRALALWGREHLHRGWPRHPLIVLTATELFAEHDIFEAWKGTDGETGEVRRASFDASNLYRLAELTQRRYLGLPDFMHEKRQRWELVAYRAKILRLLSTRAPSFPAAPGKRTAGDT